MPFIKRTPEERKIAAKAIEENEKKTAELLASGYYDVENILKRFKEIEELEKSKEEPKVTKKDLKKSINKLFKEEAISEKRKVKLLEYIENKEYEKVIKALEKKGVVFDQKY